MAEYWGLFFFSHLLFEGGHFHTEVKDEAIERLEQGRFEENLTEQGMTGQDGVISGMSCSAKTLSVNLVVVARGRCGLLGWAFQVPCYYYYWYDTIRAFMDLFFFFWLEITIVRYTSAILPLGISSLLFLL